MEQATYQALEQIINVTAMANKWMRWCEQSLPDQAVFVPSVFQMRDAYSHVITMFAHGIKEQGLEEKETEECQFDEVQFFKSDIVSTQFYEIFNHTLRAFFDTADYITERLSEICKNADLYVESNSYLLLRYILNKYDEEINSMRGRKSTTPDVAYKTVQRWDSLLQVITSAYSFADYEYSIRDLYRTVYDTVLDIEARFEESIIKEFDPNFYKEKMELVQLKELPDVYQKFKNNESEFMTQILEDPVDWQRRIIEQFNKSRNELDEKLNKYQLLLETIPSTALIRKVKGGQNQFKIGVLGFVSLVISTFVTTWIEQEMFFSGQLPVTQIDSQFVIKFCLIFSLIESVLIILGWVIYRISLSWIKKKYQRET
ncbi:MAG: hypothetical protein NC124_15880 [Clostridium sp.]|nr:hypothetical protein [Clostridium sp.]